MENLTTVSTDKAAAASKHLNERDYWLTKLSGDLEKSVFPYDHPAPAEMSPGTMETHAFSISGDLLNLVEKISTGQPHRLHIVLTAAVILTLYRYTGNKDILTGCSIYKQKTDGRFINTALVLRTVLNMQGTGKDLLLNLRQTLAEAVENQNYPMDSLLYQLGLPAASADGRGFPLFDCAVLLNPLHDKSYLEGIHVNTLFLFTHENASIQAHLEYNARLYEPDTIKRISGHFLNLLKELVSDLNAPIPSAQMTSPQERHNVLEQWNQTDKTYRGPKTLHGLFQEQVKKTPGHIALIGPDSEEKTYLQLDEMAEQAAARYRERGAGPGAIIPLETENTLQMAANILGILKTGAAYLPIDPNLPKERNEHMLKDLGQLTGQTGQLDGTELESYPAYVIYTSGSTGIPKGVVVEHRQAANTLLYRREEYGLAPGHRALQLISPTFDAFVGSFFTPLISGATLVIPDDESLKDVARINSLIAQHGITHFLTIPEFFQGIIETISETQAATLQAVTLGGGKVMPELLEEVRKKNKNLEIVNEYGLTEASVVSTLARHLERSGTLTVGQPIANTRIYILNPDNQPQGIGVPGEICIQGHGVARGYLNRPELTHRNFPPAQPGQGSPRAYRSYKSGDLGRWLPDGTIEFLGRIDRQVKIRGNRIEPGEIEARLLTHEDIREAAVTPVNHGGAYLCAFMTSDKELSVPGIRDYLTRLLPDYMVPAYMVQLERMPLTSSGKIDRKALPDARSLIASETSYVPPRNELEEQIVQTWAEILKLEPEKIGIDDNFFTMGGNSINILKVQNRLIRLTGKDLTMSAMLMYPTIRELAENELAENELTESKTAGPECIVQLNRGGNDKNLFIIHPKHGMVYQYKELAKLLEKDYDVYGVQARGLDREVPLPTSLEEMFMDYMKQIKEIQAEGPYIIAGYCLGSILAYELTRVLEDRGDKVEKLILFDIQAFFPDLYIKNLQLKEFVSRVAFKLGFKSGAPEEDEELLPATAPPVEDTDERKQKIEENNQHLLRTTFFPKRIINSPVMLIKAEESSHPRLNLKAWQKMTRGPVHFVESPGNHDTLFESPNVEQIAGILNNKGF